MPDIHMFPEVPPVFLELTNICNLHCPYCGNRNLKRPRGRISMEFVERVVHLCKTEGHHLKWLHGAGEPLLHPDLMDIVRYINRDQGLDASFATNATLLTAEKFGQLLESGLTHLYISLDSIKKDIYAKTRGADLDQVVDNIQTAISMMPDDFDLSIALMHYEDQRIDDEYLAAFRDLFGDKPNVHPNVINNVIQPASEVDMRANKYTLEHCTKHLQYFTVTYDGKVCMCCVDQDAGQELGDLTRQTINEVWYDPANQELFRKLLVGEPGGPKICEQECHFRPVAIDDPGVAPGSPEDSRARQEHARAFFTRFNPAGLTHLDRVIKVTEGRES